MGLFSEIFAFYTEENELTNGVGAVYENSDYNIDDVILYLNV